MRVLRNILIVLGIVLLVSLVVTTIIYFFLNSQNRARPEAIEALNSNESVEVSRPADTDWYVFSPVDQTAKAGFILYPGGFVDPRAYSVVAREIAEAGYLVVLDPMPLNLAVLNYGAADGIISKFPDISTWAIGGHSLGGAMAAEYTIGNPNAIDGIALWASYPAGSTDLSPFQIPIVSLYGDSDGVASIEDTTALARARLPQTTTFILIPGGNHTQFGNYGEGLQRGDNPAGISREDQQSIVVEGTIQMLEQAAQTP